MIVKCSNCEKESNKAPNQIKKSINNFCSRSCAASFNNKLYIKRKKTKKCINCDTLILSTRQKCQKCIDNLKPEDMTLGEAIYTNAHKSSAFGLVRSRARRIAKKLGWKSCKHCGYDKHIEICHIKSISDFNEDTLVSTINDPSNLIGLCPNCHWEFDHS